MGCGSSAPDDIVDNNHYPYNSATSHSSAAQASRFQSIPVSVGHISPPSSSEQESQLILMRNEFWASRVEGNVNMWVSIRAACDSLLNNDEMFANAILQAASISTPEGNVSVCYDERGVLYKVPLFCYTNDMSEEAARRRVNNNNNSSSSSSSSSSSRNDNNNGINGRNNGNDLDVQNINSNNDKGSSGDSSEVVVDEGTGSHMEIVIKVHPQIKTIRILCHTTDSILTIKANLEGETDIDTSRMRIFYMGKEYKDDATLSDIAGISSGKILQCFVKS